MAAGRDFAIAAGSPPSIRKPAQRHPTSMGATCCSRIQSEGGFHATGCVAIAAFCSRTIWRRHRRTRFVMARHAARSPDLSGALARLAVSHVPMAPPPETMSQLHVLSKDPVVLSMPDFWPSKTCDSIIARVRSHQLMERSGCFGADGQSLEVGHSKASSGRTSTSLFLTSDVAKALGIFEDMKRFMQDVYKTLGIGAGLRPGILWPETPQVACYTRGQCFSSHEDAFDEELVKSTGFQRFVTVLVYLNDVSRGGSTRFEKLDLEIRPSKGTALVFFPSCDGKSDVRTLHSAQPAIDEKWIMQLWLSKNADCARQVPT
eukprot:TRINITY_DN21037_c0_g1_i2.p1 TRINITY_DN21037_c0_g1~~TRINITY_DN21037_c0_g1_i2.p1  ORF type:complete len:318 (-),score=45.79 TRINITY_DN21037_c0_g1_i2:46-999(-)